MKKILTILAFALALLSCGKGDKAIYDLTTEMRVDPLGVDASRPRLSWKLGGYVTQQAFRIQVAHSIKDLKSEKNLVWDSGMEESDRSVLVPYAGAELSGETDYWWRVKVWTDRGESKWSEPAMWSTGIAQEDWQGSWIGINEREKLRKDENRLSARYLRKEFRVRRKVAQARLYVCGLGAARTTINGVPVAEETFSHPPTLFKRSIYYRTYDVTDLLRKGDNAIAVVLGCGRYQGLGVKTLRGVADPRLLLNLKIRYEGGREEVIASDGSWMGTSAGPIIADNEFDGEEYDAGLDLGGWELPGFTCNSVWKQVDSMKQKGRLLAMPMEDMAVQDLVTPVSVRKVGEERYIVDMGQNMVGYVKVSLEGRYGTPVVMKFAETLTAGGDSLYMANLRDAKATDKYFPARDGRFTWEPLFAYHGFRFVEITGASSAPSVEDITGKVVYDRMDNTGTFECSSDILNRIHRNAWWGIRGNYRGVPTDCPQRDERQGWLNDRAATLYGESFMFGNACLYKKWMQDIVDSMNDEGSISLVTPRNWTIWRDDAAYSATFVFIADMLRSQYGDESGITEYYPYMKKWLDHVLERRYRDGIFEFPDDEYGDWCMPPESLELIHSLDPARQTDRTLIHTAVLYDVLRLMSGFCGIAGAPQDASRYEALRSEIMTAFNARFFNHDVACYSNNTVTADILPLAVGLVPEGLEDAVMANVTSRIENDFDAHVSCGIVGMRYLMRGLSSHGAADLAFRIATQKSYPGWGYMIEKGATTIWELWNGDTAAPEMNSGNHVMLIGDLVTWMYSDLAGIQSTAPGFREMAFRPVFPAGLDSAEASYDSAYGKIHSGWRRSEDGSVTLELTVPSNTHAVAQAPEGYTFDDGAETVALSPGSYSVKLLSLRN